MASEFPYDSVEYWHERQPDDGTEEQLMAHAALYMAWLALHGMVAPGEGNEAVDADLRDRAITPLEWYWDRFANAFYAEDLTESGRRFTEAYYVTGWDTDDPDLGPFIDDYLELVPGAAAMLAEGDWSDYDRLAPRIAARHAAFLRGDRN